MKFRNKVLLTSFLIIALFATINGISAATYTLQDYDSDFYYYNNDYSFGIEFDSDCGNVWTDNYKQISSISISDSNGKTKTLKNNVNFKNYKSKNGYSVDKSFTSSSLGLNNIKKVSINFVKQPDLKLSKVTRKNNNYYVTIKNTGDAKSKKNYLGIYVSGKRIKKVTVPALSVGKQKIIKISLPNKYLKYNKKFKVDYTNRINELKKSNNEKTVKGVKTTKKVNPKKNYGGQVIITATGSKYHAYKHGNMKYISYVSLSYAKKYYGRCKVCY